MSTDAAVRHPARLPGIDLARGLALLLMFIAHVAPSDGPLRLLLLSEFLTAPLFAMLVGIGTELAQQRVAPRLGSTGFVARQLVRALALVLLGWWLAQGLAQIAIVLVPLGFLMVLCLPLARWASAPLAALGVVVAGVALALPIMVGRAAAPVGWVRLLGALGGWGPYRLAAFLLYAIAGSAGRTAGRPGPDDADAVLLAGAGAARAWVVVPRRA